MNAEDVQQLQPRVARASALPCVLSEHEIATLKGLPKAAGWPMLIGIQKMNIGSRAYSAIPFGVGLVLPLITQRSALARATLG
jgi:hypothetical protein